MGGLAASFGVGMYRNVDGLDWPIVTVLATGSAVAGAGIGYVLFRSVLSRPLRLAFALAGAAIGGVGMVVYLEVRDRVDWPVAILVAVVSGSYIGAITERVVIRRFANAPRLVLTVATIGLTQLLGGAALFVPSWFGLQSLPSSFPTGLSDRFRVVTDQWAFNGNHWLLVAVVPLIIGGLGWFLLRHRAGIAVRGMAENMQRARLLGIPVNKLSLLLWAVAGGVAGLAVILQAPEMGTSLDAVVGPTLLLPPLAAAVIARMSSLSVAFIAGVGMGVMDQLVKWNYPNKRELTYVFFLGVILLALLLQRRSTSQAQLADESSWTAVGVVKKLPRQLAVLPEVRVAKALAALVVVAVLVAIPVFGRQAQVNYATVSLVSALGALSLVILTGWGGVVSLGQMGLMGVGGITAANLIADRNSDFFVVLGASAVAGGGVALVIGLPGLRVIGQYLAVTTLAFAVVMEQYVVKPALHESFFPPRFERPKLWGEIDLENEKWMYVCTLAVVVLAAGALFNLRRARAGRSIAAVRDNERRAAAAGINGVEARLAGFVFAGMVCGFAGALHATTLHSVGEQTYPASTSLLLFSMAVIGGATITGTIGGVALVQYLGYLFPRYKLLLTGVGLLAILMVLPGGVSQGLERVRDRFANWCGKRRGIMLVTDFGPADRAREADVAVPAVALMGRNGDVDDGAAADEHILRAETINAAYGSFQVLFGVSACVQRGEMLALLGTNGAGKSSLFNVVSGLLKPRGGRVIFDGEDITQLAPEKIAERGLCLMPGGKGVFPTLSVAENMRLASWMHGSDRDDAQFESDALALFPILRERWGQRAGDMSGGEQQQLSLAMALVTKPKLLLIDELSLGLAPVVVGMLIDKVRSIHRSGTTVVVVEQSVSVALDMCEHAMFLEQGQVRFRGDTKDLLDRPDVLRAVFIGEAPTAEEQPAPDGEQARTSRGITLECHGLVKRFGGLRAVDDVDLVVPEATIIGLIGHNGAGKTTLFDVIGGFLPSDGGRVVLGGHDITGKAPHQRAVAQLGRSFQDARLFGSLTVAEAVAISLETKLANRDPLAAAVALPASRWSEADAWTRVDEIVELIGLGRFRDRPTGELSTGTRRIVELGCLLAQDPAVVLLDEPMAGVAQKESEALPPLLHHVRDVTGCSMVVIEHDMKLLGELCDQLVALELGAVIARGTPAEVLAHPRVVESYLGTDAAAIARSGPATADGGLRRR